MQGESCFLLFNLKVSLLSQKFTFYRDSHLLTPPATGNPALGSASFVTGSGNPRGLPPGLFIDWGESPDPPSWPGLASPPTPWIPVVGGAWSSLTFLCKTVCDLRHRLYTYIVALELDLGYICLEIYAF